LPIIAVSDLAQQIPRKTTSPVCVGRFAACFRLWKEPMKKIEAIIQPFKLDEVKDALTGIGLTE